MGWFGPRSWIFEEATGIVRCPYCGKEFGVMPDSVHKHKLCVLCKREVGLSNDVQNALERYVRQLTPMRKATVRLHNTTRDTHFTGVVVRNNRRTPFAYILTCHHSLEGESRIKIGVWPDQELRSPELDIAGTCSQTGLALFRISATLAPGSITVCPLDQEPATPFTATSLGLNPWVNDKPEDIVVTVSKKAADYWEADRGGPPTRAGGPLIAFGKLVGIQREGSDKSPRFHDLLTLHRFLWRIGHGALLDPGSSKEATIPLKRCVRCFRFYRDGDKYCVPACIDKCLTCQETTTFEFVEASDSPTLDYFPPPLPCRRPADLTASIDALLDLGAYTEIGRLVLTILFRPGQYTAPDHLSRQAAIEIDRAVRCRYGIPDEISYPMMYRDQYLPLQYRDQWGPDTYFTSVILGFSFSHTSTDILPLPHSLLAEFYQRIGTNQGSTKTWPTYYETQLEQFAKAFPRRPARATNPHGDAVEKIKKLMSAGLSEAEIELELRRLLGQQNTRSFREIDPE